MVRFEIEEGLIHIVYGINDGTGFFLSVSDIRLRRLQEDTEEVKKVFENSSDSLKEGDGSYFDLHTGDNGLGHKVDFDTMKAFLKRFGVSDEKIEELFE